MLQRTHLSLSSDRHGLALYSPCFAFQSELRIESVSAVRGDMHTLYSMRRSGNCYKVRLALAQLGVPYELVEVDILQGETRTPEFLAMNPSGHVPLLKVAPGKYLPESNAILWYLAEGT